MPQGQYACTSDFIISFYSNYILSAEAVLFNESIAYNIGYGKEGATQAEIEEAAKAARIYDRIHSFPDGKASRATSASQWYIG